MNPIELKRFSKEDNPHEVGKKLKEKLYKKAEEVFRNNTVCEKRK